MKTLFENIDHREAVEIILRYLKAHNIKHQRVAGYTNNGKVFVVIDGSRLNGSWDSLTKKAKEYGFDVIVHAQAFETTE